MHHAARSVGKSAHSKIPVRTKWRRRALWILALLGCVWCSLGVARAQDDLFERVFGRKPRREGQLLEVPLFINQQRHGEVQVVLTTDAAKTQLKDGALLKELKDEVRSEILQRLQAGVDARGYLLLQSLIDAGMKAEFDERELEVRIVVPPAMRPTLRHEVYGRPYLEGLPVIEPSKLSGFLNLLGVQDFVEQAQAGTPDGRQPLRLNLQGAVNFRNWVVEGDVTYQEAADEPIQRGDVRLVHDLPDSMWRTSAGDLGYPVAGFQSFVPMAGLSVTKNFSLQPYEVTRPEGHAALYLQRPSRVDIYVNNRLIQSLQLPAGPQDLSHIFLSNGANELLLIITDDVGHRQEMLLPFFFDAHLLRQGEHEFTYNVGVPRQTGNGTQHYDADHPSLSLFHRIGLTDRVTVGANLQGDHEQQLAGVEGFWANCLGIFGGDLAASHSELLGGGAAARLQYLYFDASSPWQTSFSLATEYRSPSFAVLETLQPTNPTSVLLTASYSQRLVDGLYGSVFGSYGWGRDGRPGTDSVNLSLRKRFWRDLEVDLTVGRQDLENQPRDYRALVTATWYLLDYHQRLTASSDTRDQTSTLDWNYNSPYPLGLVHAEARGQHSDLGTQFFGEADYVGNRGQVGLTQYSTLDGGTENRTSLQFGSALVFADGVFAITRPVSGSFVMVDRHPNLHGQTIGLNPFADAYEARADNLGPGVVSTLTPYMDRKLVLDAPELPLGLELGPTEFAIHPTYRSGARVRAGTDATVMLDAMLAFADGTAAFWQTGEITSADDPKWPAVPFFTNRAGRLRVEGLKPGRFQLHLSLDPKALLRFEIPQGTTGLYDLGTLRVPTPPPSTPVASAATVSPLPPATPANPALSPPPATGQAAAPPAPAPQVLTSKAGAPPPAPPVAQPPTPPAPTAAIASPDQRAPICAVQIAAYRERQDAVADAKQRAAELGQPSRVVEADLGTDGRWYRVLVGAFASEADAHSFRNRLAIVNKLQVAPVSCGPAAGQQQTAAPAASRPEAHPPIYAIQLAAYRDRQGAVDDADLITKRLGRPSHVVRVELGASGVWYRVLVGEFASSQEAEDFRRQLAADRNYDVGPVRRLPVAGQAPQPLATRTAGLATPPMVWAVQLASYRDRQGAVVDAGALAKVLGRPTHIIEVDLGSKGRWYRVGVGDFDTPDLARAFANRLRAAGTFEVGPPLRVPPVG